MRTKIFIALGLAATLSGASQTAFKLSDYYANNPSLNEAVNEVYSQLNDEERVAQMIITSLGKLGKPYPSVQPLVKERKVGGVIFLSGDPEDFKAQIAELQSLDPSWPLLMSMDAEPSLINRRLPGTPPMPPTSELREPAEIKQTVRTIDSVLCNIGFHQNFAPVVDLSASNEAIGNRNMGNQPDEVIPRAEMFIRETQQDQIIATAKHFPGHGRVQGDTHKKLVYIDGPLTELEVYPPMIEAGVLSIMVGHIAVANNEKYDTKELPSTLSPVIVSQLLREELGFEGIIITDAMNMGAVAAIPNSGLKAAQAGCDMILMPPNEDAVLKDILKEMERNQDFKQQIEDSVKRIIRMKLCLGMSFTS